jgi:hypothetical protein
MINISFPPQQFKIKAEKNKEFIFDEFRKQWVVLTPEEWVRQNFLNYLVSEKKYPASLISIEREIALGDVKKRFDIVVFKDAKPWMIVECKEMNVALNESVVKQILTYNIALSVANLVITNGSSTFCLQVNGKDYEWLNELPEHGNN